MSETGSVILAIEDEPVVRESIAAYLEDSGFDVLQAIDGRSGLDTYHRQCPDLVLVDLRMPQVDGLEVLATICKETPETPVIVVSGTGELKDAIKAIRLGAWDFITKPIPDMAVLENAIRKALERAHLLVENRRQREHLKNQIALRTSDLQERTDALKITNQRLKQEMTERLQAEEALRESQARLSAIVEVFDGFIYTCTQDFQLEFMNRKLIEHVGRDVAGSICYQGIHGFDSPCPWCVNEQVFAGETIRQELHHPKDGRWYYAIDTPILDADGSVAKKQTTILDITERKETEEALRISETHLREENIRLRDTLKGSNRFGRIIGRSPAMQDIYEMIIKAAQSNANVIIYGESGTGKELVAQTIHQLSRRSKHRFVTVHCGAIPENLMESEFFGYTKGAFTGANTNKAGYLDAADEGTLFLDEVGELDLIMQVKLLRVIDGGGFTPIGSREVKRPNVRFISATNRNFKARVEQGFVREDFYYRIHIIPIHLPSLRERKEDLPLLIHHFLEGFSDNGIIPTIPESVMAAMQLYDWPGNVRELQNAVHRYITLKAVDFADIASGKRAEIALESAPPARDANLSDVVGQFEGQYIEKILRDNRWQKAKVAQILGINRRTLFRKMQRYGLL